MDAVSSFAGLTLADFEQHLASAEPVPGGGSASAIAGSIAASLLAMVARLSLDRPKYAAYEATCKRALDTAETTGPRLLSLADEDARAYGAFAAARKMPRGNEAEQQTRDAALRAGARGASEIPLAVVRECARMIYEVEAISGRSNLNAASDLEVAARLAAAAAHGAAANVMINLPMVGDESFGAALTAEVDGLLEDIDRAAAAVMERVRAGSLREPEPA